jgi:hypothetical protein
MIKGNYQLHLLGNALDFLNSSLRYVERSRDEDNPLLWKFALFHLTQALELLLKERLRIENPILLYANLDKYVPPDQRRATVSWQAAIERLKYVLGTQMTEIDAGRLALAFELRNSMVHFDVNLRFPETYANYANVLDYLAKFYDRFLKPFLKAPLADKIETDLLEELNLAYTIFASDIVYFNDIFMPKIDRDEIQREQLRTHLTIENREYERVRYGSEHIPDGMENSYLTYADRPCHDCLTKKGDLHCLGCDVEECPRCHHQLLSCGCADIIMEEEEFAGNS